MWKECEDGYKASEGGQGAWLGTEMNDGRI